MEDAFTQQLDQDTKKWISLYFFTDVENMPEFRARVLSGEIKCCILKASMIMDTLQVAIAANRAVKREQAGVLITKSVYTEMIYLLSSSDSISASLKQFGALDDDKNIIVVVIHDEEKSDLPNEIISHIKGQLTSFTKIKEYNDLALIRKVYKIQDPELKTSTLLDSVISRIGGSYSIK